MTLVEILPDIQTLSKPEKLRLIEMLAHDLSHDEGLKPLEAGQEFPVWSPLGAYDAAAAMMAVLQKESASG